MTTYPVALEFLLQINRLDEIWHQKHLNDITGTIVNESVESVIEESEESKNPKRVVLEYEEGELVSIHVSQSLIKLFLYKGDVRDYCPSKIYHTRIIRDVEDMPTESMEKGNFFETLCLGSSAHDATNSLPLLLNGKKSADQQRIEEQALAFKSVCEKYGIIS